MLDATGTATRVAQGVTGLLIRTYLTPTLGALALTLSGIIGSLVWHDINVALAKLDLIAALQVAQGEQIAVINAERARGRAENETFKADIKEDVRVNSDALSIVGKAQAADEVRLEEHGRRLDRLEQRR